MRRHVAETTNIQPPAKTAKKNLSVSDYMEFQNRDGSQDFFFLLLHGPPMLVDKTNFCLLLYNHTNFYRSEETSTYWSVKRISVFLCFSLVNQRHTSGITVYNSTVTNIENTAQAAKTGFLQSFYMVVIGGQYRQNGKIP